GSKSGPIEFTTGPRLTGADQSEKRGAASWLSSSAASPSLSASPVDVRVDIQMSLPRLPARSDANMSVRPSNDRLGWSSAADVLTGDPKFSGTDQGSCALRRIDIQSAARVPATPEPVNSE